jgi:lipoprotein
MKKIFLVLMLAFLLVSCNQNKKIDNNKDINKSKDVLQTEIKEDIDPNLESQINVE